MKQSAVIKDSVIYMVAKGIEAIVGVMTMSVMTFLFMSEQMGQYSTINIAITTIGLVSTQWLTQAVLRYVNKYDVQGEKDEFFSTVFNAWLKSNIIVVGIIFLCLLIIEIFCVDQEIGFWVNNNLRVILVGILWLITYNASQLVVSVISALRYPVLNMFLSIITVVGKIVLIILFCKIGTSKIEWIFLSYFLVDGLVACIGTVKLRLYQYIGHGRKSKGILKELQKYGTPLMGNMVATSVLNKSDIYIVTAFLGASAAGIYQTNYSLVATAFTMLSSAIMRGNYPTILRVWSEGRKEQATHLVSAAARFYLLLAIPAVVGVGVLSDVIAKVLYAPEYFSGNDIMIWVAAGMMILGLTEYNIKPWEMNAKTKSIFLRSLIGGLVNVVLNLIFVPVFGYKTAAITTFLGFFVYFVLARIGTRKYAQWSLPLSTFLKIGVSSVGMALLLLFMKKILPINLITLIIMVVIGAAIYGIILLMTGEVKEEAKSIVTIVKRKCKR